MVVPVLQLPDVPHAVEEEPLHVDSVVSAATGLPAMRIAVEAKASSFAQDQYDFGRGSIGLPGMVNGNIYSADVN